MNVWRWLASAALVWTWGCASNRAAEAPVQAAPLPQAEASEVRPEEPGLDIATAEKRELAPLPKHRVPFPERFGAEVEASATPEVKAHGDGIFEVHVPLAPTTKLRCYVYPQFVDPGTAMGTVAKQVGARFELRQFAPTKIRADDVDPIIYSDLIYAHEGNIGLLKIAAFASDEVTALCTHDQIGYAKTFERITTALIASLRKTTPPARKAIFGELQVISIGDRDIGFEQTRIFPREEGGDSTEALTFVLLPKSKTELSFELGFKITDSDARGRIEKMMIEHRAGEEVKHHVEVRRTRGNEYAYEGMRLGEEIEGTFRATDKAGLPSDATLARHFQKRFFQSPKKGYRVEKYDPNVDPAKPIGLELRPKDPTARTAQWEIAGRSFTSHYDAAGRMERLEMEGSTMVQARVATVGALP